MSGESDKSIYLHDGRRLGYAEAGDPAGWPVLYFHGIPGSRREQHPQSAIAEELGLRVIVLERPGYGLSELQPGRRLLDWVTDGEEFADRLELSRFSVMGFSGGGPYALACAHGLARRITSTSLIGSSSPYAAMERCSGSMMKPGRAPYVLPRRGRAVSCRTRSGSHTAADRSAAVAVSGGARSR